MGLPGDNVKSSVDDSPPTSAHACCEAAEVSPAPWDSPALGSRRPGTLDPGHLQAMFSPTKAQPRLFLLFKNSISFYEPVMMWLTISC